MRRVSRVKVLTQAALEITGDKKSKEVGSLQSFPLIKYIINGPTRQKFPILDNLLGQGNSQVN